MLLRLLVLDECRLLAWIVKQLCPLGTEVLSVTSFEEARRALIESPPDAAVVSITLARLPWRDFQILCANREPSVPVLFQSCVFASAEEAGLEPVEGYAGFLRKPAEWAEFRDALTQLLEAAREVRGAVAG